MKRRKRSRQLEKEMEDKTEVVDRGRRGEMAGGFGGKGR